MRSSLKFSMAFLTLFSFNSCVHNVTKENSGGDYRPPENSRYEAVTLPENSSLYKEIRATTKSSELIVLGKIVSKKSRLELPCYLTEYEVKIEDILKRRKKKDILLGDKITIFGAGGKLKDGSSVIFAEPSFEDGNKYLFFLNHEIPKRYLQKNTECIFQYSENVYVAYSISPKVENGRVILSNPIQINQSFDSFKDLVYRINQIK